MSVFNTNGVAINNQMLGTVFDSIGALRANNQASTVVKTCTVNSYYGTGSGSVSSPPMQWAYYINPTDTTSADNGWSIIVDAAGNRWYALIDKIPSITQLGAKVNDTTSGSAVFSITESSTINTWYVPPGTYLSQQPYLIKNYVGPGSIVNLNGVTLNGTSSKEMLKKKSGLHLSNAVMFTQVPRSWTWVGDSITEGTGASNNKITSYAAMLQKMVNNSMSFGQGNFLSGGMFNILNLNAPYTRGTGGVGQQSVILAPGGSIGFSADYIDTVSFFYNRTPSSGSLTLTVNGTAGTAVACAGTAQLDAQGVLTTTARTGKSANFYITCTGAAVELTGLSVFHALSGTNNYAANPVFLTFQGFSGYNTTSFLPMSVATSLIAQNPLPQLNFAGYVLAFGTNDIFNVSTANTSAVFKSNLDTIIQNIRTAAGTSCTIVLTVPLNARSDFRTPVLEPFNNYRESVYQLATKWDLDVVDLSELDLITVGATADGLHPNDYGHSIIATTYYERLFASLSIQNRIDAIAVVAPCTLQQGQAIATMSKGGAVNLSGNYNVTGIAKGSQILSIPLGCAPLQSKVVTVPCWGGGGSPVAGSAILTISPAGGVVLFDFSPPNISFVSLDGVFYTVS